VVPVKLMRAEPLEQLTVSPVIAGGAAHPHSFAPAEPSPQLNGAVHPPQFSVRVAPQLSVPVKLPHSAEAAVQSSAADCGAHMLVSGDAESASGAASVAPPSALPSGAPASGVAESAGAASGVEPSDIVDASGTEASEDPSIEPSKTGGSGSEPQAAAARIRSTWNR
jgi:hypothetical protein